jgi:tripartite-type tricarboxylate transporter receptor subunit TctC
MKNFISRTCSSLILSFFFTLFAVQICCAQNNYPSKPVRVILPFLGGGALDQMARIVSENLSARMNQSFFVDVKAGAGGVIGADFVAKSIPDGYTLLFSVQAPLTAAPFLNKQLPYDGLNAFAPVSIVTEAPNVLIAWPGVSFRTVAEFLAVARSAPNRLSFASQGQGTTGHITGAMIDQVAGTQLLHIPYKGFPPMLTDLETGRVDMMFADSINAIPRIKSKELVAIAVASDKRIASIADVPTFAESGLPNIVSGPMFGLYAPAGTPTEILNKLHSEIQMILKIPTVSKTLKDLGVETRGYSPEESMRVLRAESVRTRDAIKATGIQVNQ